MPTQITKQKQLGFISTRSEGPQCQQHEDNSVLKSIQSKPTIQKTERKNVHPEI